MMTTANLPASTAGLIPRAVAALATLDWRPLVYEDGLDLACFPRGAQTASDGELQFVRFVSDAEHHRGAEPGSIVVEVMDWSADDDDSFIGTVIVSASAEAACGSWFHPF